MRLPSTTYVYGDPDHPDRVTEAIGSPPYSEDDRALLAAVDMLAATRCPGGDHSIREAWHSDMDGWYDGHEFVCHACSARQGREVVYTMVTTSRDFQATPLPEFVLGGTTTPPSKSTS